MDGAVPGDGTYPCAILACCNTTPPAVSHLKRPPRRACDPKQAAVLSTVARCKDGIRSLRMSGVWFLWVLVLVQHYLPGIPRPSRAQQPHSTSCSKRLRLSTLSTTPSCTDGALFTYSTQAHSSGTLPGHVWQSHCPCLACYCPRCFAPPAPGRFVSQLGAPLPHRRPKALAQAAITMPHACRNLALYLWKNRMCVPGCPRGLVQRNPWEGAASISAAPSACGCVSRPVPCRPYVLHAQQGAAYPLSS